MNPSGSSPSSEVSEQELVRRKDFLEFGDADVSNLAEINELAQRYADAVIEDFYKHLLSFEETRSFFHDPQRSAAGQECAARIFFAPDARKI